MGLAAFLTRKNHEALERLKCALGADLERLKMKEQHFKETIRSLRKAKKTIDRLSAPRGAEWIEGGGTDFAPLRAYNNEVAAFWEATMQIYRGIHDHLDPDLNAKIVNAMDEAQAAHRAAWGLDLFGAQPHDRLEVQERYRNAIMHLKATIHLQLNTQISRVIVQLRELLRIDDSNCPPI